MVAYRCGKHTCEGMVGFFLLDLLLALLSEAISWEDNDEAPVLFDSGPPIDPGSDVVVPDNGAAPALVCPGPPVPSSAAYTLLLPLLPITDMWPVVC